MKNVFPKQTSLAVAASLCLLSIGHSQENQDRPTGRDREGRQDVQEGELHGKIMPLKAFLSDGQETSASNESEEMNQPLVLVVDDRRGARTGATTESNTDTATGNTATDQDRRDRRGPRTGERAYVLVFQNDSVKEKAERLCKENKGHKHADKDKDATAANEADAAQAHAEGDKMRVAVTGERSFRGGLMAIMVSDISEGAESTTGNQDQETRTETQTETRTQTQTGDATEADAEKDDAEKDDN